MRCRSTSRRTGELPRIVVVGLRQQIAQAVPPGGGVRSFPYMRIHSSPAVSLVVAIPIPIKEPLPWTCVRPIL